MKIMPNASAKGNQRITARLRHIQGQVAALERSLASDHDYDILLQRVADARGAMNGLMAVLVEERSRTLQKRKW
jgi:DNA-binding FrmR family transcriptional regulator